MLPFTLFENVDQARSYLKKKDIPETDWVYKLVRNLFRGREGYVGWVTRIAYENIVPLCDNDGEIRNTLENLATKLATEKHILDTLPKPIIQYETYEEFVDDFEKQIVAYKAKKMWDEFPSTQKGLMRMGNKGDTSLLSKLFDDETNKVFLRKIAAYKTREQLVDAIKRFINKKGSSDFDGLLKSLHREGLPIVHADEINNLIIARILDYNQCRTVGSRTSWCIARDASTFRSYIPDGLTRQYVIYQTDLPESDDNNIIGATFNLQGYRTAHNRRDGYIGQDILKKMLTDHGYDIKGLGLKIGDLTPEDINNCSVKDLRRMGQTNEQIVKIKKLYRSGDLTHFTKEELEKYDLLNKTTIGGDLLKKYTKEEIISKNLIGRVERNSLHIETLLELGFTRDEIQKIPDLLNKLYDEDRKYYDKYLKKSKSQLIKGGAYGLRFGSSWTNNRDDDRYDAGKTLGIMRWYGIGPKDFSLNDLTEALDDVSTYEYQNIKNYLDEAGYKYTEDELVKFLFNVSRGHVEELDRYIALIDMGIDKYDEVVKNVMSRHKPLSSWESGKVQKVLKPEDYEKFKDIDKRNLFVQETLGTGGAFWNKQQNPLSVTDYWNKWGDYGSMIDLDGFAYEHGGGYGFRYGKEVVLSYILLCALNDKFDYLYNLKFAWEAGKGYRSWATHTFMGELMGTLCGTNITNGDPTIKIEEKLTEELRQKLYKWVIEHVWPKITDKVYFKYDMQVAYFMFDKTRFNQYVDEVKKLKDNYKYTTNKDTEKTVTFRIHELEPIVDFFKKEHSSYKSWYYKTHDTSTVMGYFQEFLNYFLSGIKMLKTERLWTIRALYKHDYRRDEENTMNKIIGDTFNVGFREYRDNQLDIIDKSLKESVITDYIHFRAVR